MPPRKRKSLAPDTPQTPVRSEILESVCGQGARGMTVRGLQAFLAEMYAVEVSPDLISAVTDSVVAEATAWQQRPLEPMYAVVYFDRAARQDPRQGDRAEQGGVPGPRRAANETRDILGIWIEQKNSG